MNNVIKVAVSAAFLLSLAGTAAAQTATSTSVTQVQNLLVQIQNLQKQINELQSKQSSLKQELTSTMQITRNLVLGMTGEEVKTLQALLATDPEIYPEGIVSGFFGPLTEKAVRKFQSKFGIVSSGSASSTGFGKVGPKTLSRINQLLTEGNASGKVPPGLLIAPGIAKKLGFTPQPLPGQKIPPGIAKKLGNGTSTSTTTPDTTAPSISLVSSSGTTASTTNISWLTNESSTSKVWYGTTTPVDLGTASTASNSSLVFSHAVGLSSLNASTTYYYLVSSADASGNNATSSTNSFTTSQ